MSGIRGQNTKPEMLLRRALHARGFRYRLHEKKLPGKPDLIFAKYGAVVFVHGCFWHRHEGCKYTTTPATREEFWQKKFCDNVARDIRNIDMLRQTSWRVAIVWECEVKARLTSIADDVANWLGSSEKTFGID